MARAVRAAVLACVAGAWTAAAPPTASARRAIPDTTAAIHVWDDQLPDDISAAQVRFLARRVDGTQKVSRRAALALRAHNPGFLVLHYRLAIADGPEPFRIGEDWGTDYAAVRQHGAWFWREGGRPVFARRWRWYLMDPASGWRSYWADRVLREARLLGDDGVFADSLGAPQYLGATGVFGEPLMVPSDFGAASFSPPVTSLLGEAAWSRRLDRFMRYERRRLRGRLWFVPNAGSWASPRDRTDYAIADGAMIEGFAVPAAGALYTADTWRLQMDRALRLARRGRIVIGQASVAPGDVRARMFALASYALTQGRHSFVNLNVGLRAQWFPEYGIRLGAARTPPPADIDALRTPSGLYARRFRHGVVVVNPGDVARTYAFPGTRRLVWPRGGGVLPPDADVSAWGLSERAVRGAIALPPRSGAVLSA
jgi:hypothetical protein